MRFPFFVRSAALLPLLGMTAPLAAAPVYPDRPIRMLTAEAGGGADFMARLVAQGLSERFGQQVVVDNRGAASGAVAGEIVANALPDGYTLLFFGPSIWLLPFLRSNVPFDPVRDFAPITQAMQLPDILVVHPTVQAQNVRELVALAKARPGAINYSTGGSASATHLAGELFKSMAGANIVRIAYKGTGAALNALIGGEVQLMFPAIAAGMPQVKAGRLRALAVTSAQPTELAPGLPTVAAAGLSNYEAVLMLGVFAPAKTPASLIQFLNREIAQLLQSPAVKEKLFVAGAQGVGSTPAQFAATLKADMAKWGKLIRDAHIGDN
jgi:tripartite-type tricarboxylate transporter receptor subunit TctC